MKEGLKDEPVTHGGVGLDPSHNDVGWNSNRRSSHIVGQPHKACDEGKMRAIGYVVAKVDDEIICSNDLDPMSTINKTAQDMMRSYPMGTDNKRAELEHLVYNFKPKDKPSDDIYDAVHEAMFGGS